MHIAVVIPAFNVAPFLGTAIGSVLRQTHTNWSLTVVDDGSTDPTRTIAARFHDQRIHLIQQTNQGASAARNAGIAACEDQPVRPDAYLFLDGDDWLAPDALDCLASALVCAPTAVAAFGSYARVSTGGTSRIVTPDAYGDILERLVIRNLFANGGHLLIRRSAIAAAGWFRTDLTFGEDWEYWVRLALAGNFTATRGTSPLLFVRERSGSASMSRAADPQAYQPALAAIHANPEVARVLGVARLHRLRTAADAEIAWAVGRELIRHGQKADGTGWLWRSIRQALGAKRFLLTLIARLRLGPFRPYPVAKHGRIAAL